jgi:two-component sensor histidine kinase
MFGLCIDITENKRMEDSLVASLREKEMLLQELNHRVNNNLQLISSLLTLQGKFTQDPSALTVLAECKNRIKSIALVHERLYLTKGFSSINIGEYISELARNIFDSLADKSAGISLRVDVENVPLNIERAITCGLIINELVSNSLKYAFAGRSSGEITISLRKAGENVVELVCGDNGVGMPKTMDLRTHKSLGLLLIHTMAEKQLEARVQVTCDPGTVFTVTFKIA